MLVEQILFAAVESIPQMRSDVTRAVEILRKGGVVALPTETVYGLGADASNPEAVAKIFALKNRPADHPLIVHISGIDKLPQWVDEIPASAQALASRFWPGPLTMIFKRAPAVLDAVTGGQDTIGLRVPNHPLTLEVLAEFGGGVAAPSANRFGKISPTRAEHVAEEFGDRVDYILDGGPCAVGLESTIVDLTSARPQILRLGAVTAEDIDSALGHADYTEGSGCVSREGEPTPPKTPGSLAAHYAPETPLHLVDSTELATRVLELTSLGRSVGVIARTPAPSDEVATGCVWVVISPEPAEYGRLLYATMRELDHMRCDVILVEAPPALKDWEAIADRLTRAASATHQASAGRAINAACFYDKDSGT